MLRCEEEVKEGKHISKVKSLLSKMSRLEEFSLLSDPGPLTKLLQF
jgi:hypothetical protein